MHDGAPVGARLRTSHVSSVPLRRREMDLREAKTWYLYSCVFNLFFPNIHWDEMRECVRVYGAVWSEERCRKSKLLTISLSIFFLEHNPFMFFWVMLKYHVV